MTKLNQLLEIAGRDIPTELLHMYLGYKSNPTFEEMENAINLFRNPKDNDMEIRGLMGQAISYKAKKLIAGVVSDSLAELMDVALKDRESKVPENDEKTVEGFTPNNPFVKELLKGLKSEKSVCPIEKMYDNLRKEMASVHIINNLVMKGDEVMAEIEEEENQLTVIIRDGKAKYRNGVMHAFTTTVIEYGKLRGLPVSIYVSKEARVKGESLLDVETREEVSKEESNTTQDAYKDIVSNVTIGETRCDDVNKVMHSTIQMELCESELNTVLESLIKESNDLGYSLNVYMLYDGDQEFTRVYSTPEVETTTEDQESDTNVEEEDADSKFFKTAYKQYLKFMEENGITPSKTLEDIRAELSKEDHVDMAAIMTAVKKPYNMTIDPKNLGDDTTKCKGMPIEKVEHDVEENISEDSVVNPEEEPTYKRLEDLTDEEIIFLNKEMVKMFDEGTNLNSISLSLFGSNPYDSCIAFLKAAANKYSEECKKRGVSNSGIETVLDFNSPLYKGIEMPNDKPISKRKAKNRQYWKNKKNKSKSVK